VLEQSPAFTLAAMVQLIVRLIPASGRSHHLVQALHSLIRRAAQSTGCRSAHLSADIERADVFWYCEEWDDASALEAKVRTEQFSELLALMETSVEPPLLEFRVIDDVKGLDYVARVRGGAMASGQPPRPL
jgi:quinol monooxygenase YgiN